MERTEWLVAEVMPTLRQTAGTLLIHGFGSGRVWDEFARRSHQCLPRLRIRDPNQGGVAVGHIPAGRLAVVSG